MPLNPAGNSICSGSNSQPYSQQNPRTWPNGGEVPYAIEPSWEQYLLTPSMSPNKAVLVIPAIYGNRPVTPFPAESDQERIKSRFDSASGRYARGINCGVNSSCQGSLNDGQR